MMLALFIIYELIAMFWALHLMRLTAGTFPLMSYIITGHLWPYIVVSSLFRGKGGGEE